MAKLWVSKNYYYWITSDTGKVFDIRNSHEFEKEEDIPEHLALDPAEIETKILIYEDRVKGWFLDIAKKLKDDGDAGFVILFSSLAYIEGNQQLREGKSSKGKSGKFFTDAMNRIFYDVTLSKEILEGFYDKVRCGLFHDGITRINVEISGEYPKPLSYVKGIFRINPHIFLDRITQDLESYIGSLRDKSNKKLRKSFEGKWL